MAWRIHQTVVRAEIDNRQRGRVQGSIWLLGREQPVKLDLSGNCSRDLAGCIVRFINLQPIAAEKERADLHSMQKGVVGDITASRKVRVFDVEIEEAMRIAREGGTPPEHTANSLYLEWFSEANGRVVIESVDYKVETSPPAWTLSREDEKEQITATQQALRDWLERLDESLHHTPTEFDLDEERPLDEFGYEKFMRESDARTDKYMEIREKYEGHPDREKIVAREMGWAWLEEALEADERGALPPRKEIEVPPLEPNPLTEGIDWVRDKDGGIHHPLTRRAFESAMSMWHFCKERGLLEESGDDDLHEMIFQFQTVGAKVAGALDSLGYDEHLHEGGFVVAALKRALNYLHASVAAAERVASKNLLDSGRLNSFRADLFNVREEILGLMQRFRSKSP